MTGTFRFGSCHYLINVARCSKLDARSSLVQPKVRSEDRPQATRFPQLLCSIVRGLEVIADKGVPDLGWNRCPLSCSVPITMMVRQTRIGTAPFTFLIRHLKSLVRTLLPNTVVFYIQSPAKPLGPLDFHPQSYTSYHHV